MQNLIDDYGSRIARYMVDYSTAEPVTEDIKKDCLMQLVPEKLETAIKDSIMTVERDGNEMDYASLRAIIVKRVEGDSEQGNDPMDVSLVEQERAAKEREEVNALGTGKGQPPNSCNRCWRQGHHARDVDVCPKGGGKAKGGRDKGKGKGKGKVKGKGKGKYGGNG